MSYGISTTADYSSYSATCGSTWGTYSPYSAGSTGSGGGGAGGNLAVLPYLKGKVNKILHKKKPWTFAELSDNQKQLVRGVIELEWIKYETERRVKNMLSGLKWLLILLGIGILLNFGRILSIIEMLVRK